MNFHVLPCRALSLLLFVAALCSGAPPAADRPNILWITLEDMSANLGCFGDPIARTPNIDAFAREAVRYTRAFSTAPVCSPARACLISGVYATSLGNPHLRCEVPVPAEVKGYATHLREAGYFTSNNAKTDYNLRDEPAFVRRAWTRNGGNAHWRQREPGQPFMSVFNFMETHQSRSSVWPKEQFEREIRSRLPADQRVDPARVTVPGFYPDTPSAREAMARYYDCIAAADARVGDILQQLKADGLAEDTIVFFFSDHGMGMPRGKRVLYDSGLHVPLLIRFPPKWRHLAPAGPGTPIDRLVSFVDFPPTLLSLAGIPVPAYMQGVAFLGPAAGPPREYVFGARDRVDEAIDTARSVRDTRWLYIRNFRPHLSWAAPEGFSDNSTFRRELLAAARDERAGTGATSWLAPTRPLEELYDTAADPQQLRNLAADPQHRATLEQLRAQLKTWLLETHDTGFLPEPEVLARSGGGAPFEMLRRHGAVVLGEILGVAERVGETNAASAQRTWLAHGDPAVRYWAAVGLRANPAGAKPARADLEKALRDSSGAVRVEAAGALLAQGPHEPALQLLATELRSADGAVVVQAARTLELAGPNARPILPIIKQRLAHAQRAGKGSDTELYVRFAFESLLRELDDK